MQQRMEMCTKIPVAAGINITGMGTGRLHQRRKVKAPDLIINQVVDPLHLLKCSVQPRIVQGAMLPLVAGVVAEEVAVVAGVAVAAVGVAAAVVLVAVVLAAAEVVVLAEEGKIILLSIYYQAIVS